MQVNIIRDIDDFVSAKEKWNSLFNNRKYSVFQSFNYNYYSWLSILSKEKNKLHILLISKENILISICPFYLDRYKTLRFINDIHTDYCDILLDEVFDLNIILSKFLFVRRISFMNLLKDSNILKVFKYSNYKLSYSINDRKISCLYLKKGLFPDNYDIFRSKHKSEFRRICKKYPNSKHLLLTYKDTLFPIEEIKELRSKMINLGLRKDGFLDNSLLELICDLYNKGDLIISLIKKKKKNQAISFLFVKNSEYLVWIDMYDNSKMINLFNYISFISLLSHDKDVNIHFGRGDYKYKVKNFLPTIDNLIRIEVFFNWFYYIIYQIASYILIHIKNLYKKILSESI